MLGIEWSCVPDAEHPWDPAVMRAIWEFDPEAVPLWCRWTFLPPSDEGWREPVTFGRHAMGRAKPISREWLPPFPVEMPEMPVCGVSFKRPTLIEPATTSYLMPMIGDVPGPYIPFDWDVYYFHRASFNDRHSPREVAQIRREAEEAKMAAAKRQREAWIADRDKDIGRYIDKKLANASTAETEEYLRRMEQNVASMAFGR